MSRQQQNRLPSLWRVVPFEKCVKTDRIKGGKLQSKDYREIGRYPIVDQGQEFIAGYSDRSDLVYDGELPVVIFGDHTRIFKYVDFSFIRGADGVKVLIPRYDIIDPEYLYYCAQTLPVPDKGYSRHYRYLREVRLPLPPLPEQRRIVAILRKADELRQLRRRANERAKDLLPALFYEMFGDVDHDSGHLGKYCEFYSGSTLPSGIAFDEQSEGALLLKVGDLNDPQNEFFVTKSREWCGGECSGTLAPKNTIVFPKRGGAISTNKKAILKRKAFLDPNLMGVRIKDENPDTLHAIYLFQWFRNFDLLRITSGSTVPQLNIRDLKPLLLPIPDYQLQLRFADTFLYSLTLLQYQTKGTLHTNELFQSLLARAFTGELTAAWREAQAAELAAAAAERDGLLGIEKEQQPQQLQIVIAPKDINRSLGNLSAVVDEIVRSQQALLKQMVKVHKLNLPNFTNMADSLRPALAQADIVNSAIKTQMAAMAAIDTSALESMVRATQPLADMMRSQQIYYADLLDKLAQVARMELDEPPTRSEIEAEVLETAAELPDYFTLHDLANDWRLNHFSVHAIEEAVDMLVVRGRLRSATLKLETDDPERPYDLVDAYAVVTDADLVSAQEIDL